MIEAPLKLPRSLVWKPQKIEFFLLVGLPPGWLPRSSRLLRVPSMVVQFPQVVMTP